MRNSLSQSYIELNINPKFETRAKHPEGINSKQAQIFKIQMIQTNRDVLNFDI